jgi:tetratricopeptide (TPR) repeat protein
VGRFTSLEFEKTQPEDEVRLSEPEKELPGEKPRDASYFIALAALAYHLANYEKAMQFYSKALTFDPSNRAAWTAQVRCLIHLSEFKEASMWADKGLQLLGEDPELFAAKAVALCRMGDFSRAYGLSDVSIGFAGDNPFVWLSRGEILLHQKKSNSEFCFQKALSSAGGSWEISLEIARIHMFYGNTHKALAVLQGAVSDNPSNAVLWYELGNSFRNTGMREKAMQAYFTSLELEPKFEMAKKAISETKGIGLFSLLKAKLFGRR